MNQGQTTRRRLLTAVGAAGLGSLMVGRARAATIEALAVACMDYRLVDDTVHFLDAQRLKQDYDLVCLAGASLAAVSDKFPTSNAAFWEHVGFASRLHHVKRLIVIDHRDCGAYKLAYGSAFQGRGAAETAQHKKVMEQAKAELTKRYPGLAGEFWLMNLDGQAERII